jgi:hypothetical protein
MSLQLLIFFSIRNLFRRLVRVASDAGVPVWHRSCTLLYEQLNVVGYNSRVGKYSGSWTVLSGRCLALACKSSEADPGEGRFNLFLPFDAGPYANVPSEDEDTFPS